MGIPSLNIYGDSSVIINGANIVASLDSPCLDHWCQDIGSHMNNFSFLVIKHIYRERNQRVDCLSKEALDLAPGSGIFTKIIDGLNDLKRVFQLF